MINASMLLISEDCHHEFTSTSALACGQGILEKNTQNDCAKVKKTAFLNSLACMDWCFTITADVQVCSQITYVMTGINACMMQLAALDKACKLQPDAVWWIKCDGCDVVSGLGDSVAKKWSGDIDLNDGNLKKQYEEYRRINFIASLGVRSSERIDMDRDMIKTKGELEGDLSFISSGMRTFNVTCKYVI